MTTAALMPRVHTDQQLSNKQRKYREKYAHVNPEYITDRVRDSWNRPAPGPMNGKLYKILTITVLLLIVGCIVGVLIGTPDMSGLYFLTTQTNHTVKETWDGSIPTFWRHLLRDDGIGLAGGLLIVYTNLNRYKPLKPLNWFDRFEMNFHIWIPWFGVKQDKRYLRRVNLPISNIKDDKPFSIWQFFGSAFLIFPYASVGFFIGQGLIAATHLGFVHHALNSMFGWIVPTLKAHASAEHAALITRMHDSMTQSLPGKFTGLLMAFFFGRRPVKGQMSDVQLFLCQHRYMRYVQAGQLKRGAP